MFAMLYHTPSSHNRARNKANFSFSTTTTTTNAETTKQNKPGIADYRDRA
jgi:hypothetical protein